jgi:hypothetical protein
MTPEFDSYKYLFLKLDHDLDALGSAARSALGRKNLECVPRAVSLAC